MRFLLIPGNNSLSHVAKCLTVEKYLKNSGHEALTAVSLKNARFLHNLGLAHSILPDIQEIDHAALPTMTWFSQSERIVDCIKAEINLLEAYKPDRVLGVFRFTLKASAHIVGIPFDSLTCGCMALENKETLGFRASEPGIEMQEAFLLNFFRYAGKKTSQAMSVFGLEGVSDIRWMLKGERTFLWDFPEFMPLPDSPDLIHVGPVVWEGWPYDDQSALEQTKESAPIAVITLGTCTSNESVVQTMTNCLLSMGYHVIFAAGGQMKFMPEKDVNPRVRMLQFAPLSKLFRHANILLTHGGQMTVFEALLNKTPVGVIPFQPEQAHNGVCLERIGCGRRLVPAVPFKGNQDGYADAFRSCSTEKICARIRGLVNNPKTPERLTETERVIRRYRGAETIAMLLEEKA